MRKFESIEDLYEEVRTFPNPKRPIQTSSEWMRLRERMDQLIWSIIRKEGDT